MKLKVGILSDYKGDFGHFIKILSPNNDSKIKIGDYTLEFVSFDSNDNEGGGRIADCDYIVVVNKSLKNMRVKTKRVFALQQEPYIRESKKYSIPFKNEWAIIDDYYLFCDVVFAFNDELFKDKNLIEESPKTFVKNNTTFIKHHPALYFCFGNVPFDTLCKMPPPKKTKEMSCIASFDKKAFYGHLDRIKFVTALKKSNIGKRIDFFGNKTEFELQEKKDGILPYKYTIAIENNSQNDYVSEKIMDSYLGYSIPIYFGASNVDEYFPKNSFIKIDIYNLQDSLNLIENILDSNFYETNFDALLEARKKVLYDYSMLYSLSKNIINDAKSHYDNPKRDVLIPRYKRSFKYLLKYYYQAIFYGLLKILTNGEGKNKLKDLS
ncbi:MAG: hypothetical protein IKC84_00975 [Helicobacteraceae bacterium]|nr:hypothetical protein [Helicobacteraceae bacterium]